MKSLETCKLKTVSIHLLNIGAWIISGTQKSEKKVQEGLNLGDKTQNVLNCSEMVIFMYSQGNKFQIASQSNFLPSKKSKSVSSYAARRIMFIFCSLNAHTKK